LAIAAPSAGAPRISVVVVSSGRASLDAALASIAAQDYPDVDVVVAAANPEHPPVAGRLGAHQVRFLPAESAIGHAAAAVTYAVTGRVAAGWLARVVLVGIAAFASFT